MRARPCVPASLSLCLLLSLVLRAEEKIKWRKKEEEEEEGLFCALTLHSLSAPDKSAALGGWRAAVNKTASTFAQGKPESESVARTSLRILPSSRPHTLQGTPPDIQRKKKTFKDLS